MGKGTVVPLGGKAKPVLVAYGTLTLSSRDLSEPINYKGIAMSLYIPAGFSVENKTFKLFCSNELLYEIGIGTGSAYPGSEDLICMINKPFVREVMPGETVALKGRYNQNFMFRFPATLTDNGTSVSYQGQIAMQKISANAEGKAWTTSDGEVYPNFCAPFKCEFYE